jgi:quercetin dioxygenase-like cupin family protein
MRYARIYSDEIGETHFDDIEVALTQENFAPPAPPLNLSPYIPVTQFRFCCFPAGWIGEWHPAPTKQLFFVLSGELAGEVSDGNVRNLKSGEVALVEDTDGKGHRTWVVSDEDVMTAVIQIPDNRQ